MGGGVVGPIIGVSLGRIAVLLAPKGNRRPLGVAHKMPALPLGLAILPGLVKGYIGPGVLHRQAVCPLVHNDIGVLGDADFRDFFPAYDKGWMGNGRAPINHIRNLEFRDPHHDRGHPHIIQQDSIVGVDRFHCQLQGVKIAQHFIIPPCSKVSALPVSYPEEPPPASAGGGHLRPPHYPHRCSSEPEYQSGPHSALLFPG